MLFFSLYKREASLIFAMDQHKHNAKKTLRNRLSEGERLRKRTLNQKMNEREVAKVKADIKVGSCVFMFHTFSRFFSYKGQLEFLHMLLCLF